MGIQFAFTGVFRAAGNTMMAMVLGIISMFILEIPLAYGLALYTPLAVDGIWRAFPLTNIAMAIICFLIYQKGNWKNKNLTESESSDEAIAE